MLRNLDNALENTQEVLIREGVYGPCVRRKPGRTNLGNPYSESVPMALVPNTGKDFASYPYASHSLKDGRFLRGETFFDLNHLYPKPEEELTRKQRAHLQHIIRQTTAVYLARLRRQETTTQLSSQ